MQVNEVPMAVHGPTGNDVQRLILMSYEILMNRHPHEVEQFLADAKDRSAIVKIRGETVKTRGDPVSGLKHFALLHYIDFCANMTKLNDYLTSVQAVLYSTTNVEEAVRCITCLMKSRI